jgi:hypothetical protein
MCQQSATSRSTDNRQVPHKAGAPFLRYGAPHIDAIVTFLQQPHELMPMQLLRLCNGSRNSSRAAVSRSKNRHRKIQASYPSTSTSAMSTARLSGVI